MKKIVVWGAILSLIVVSAFGFLVYRGQDNQSPVIIFVKHLIPEEVRVKLKYFLRDSQIEKLELKRAKDGSNGSLFSDERIKSELGEKYRLKQFYLPFPKKDHTRHYLEVSAGKVLVISGVGKSIYFEAEKLNDEKLDYTILRNNIRDVFESLHLNLIDVRDIQIQADTVYLSALFRDQENRYSFIILSANLNWQALEFSEFLILGERWKWISVTSGGKLEEYKNNQLLFSMGDFDHRKSAQDTKTYLGKILRIDIDTKATELVSIGHRNPQGLEYIESLDTIVNTEHGPMGGDEVNLHKVRAGVVPNFGWDVASYGLQYGGADIFKHSHQEHGFTEPLTYFTPSIGVSELILDQSQAASDPAMLLVSSLRANSLFLLALNEEFDQVVQKDRLFFPLRRIRDIDYHSQKHLLIFDEPVPIIASLIAE